MADNNEEAQQFQLPAGLQGCYSVLGVSRNATSEQIKRAYRAKMLVHHQDKGGTKEMSQLLNKAYQTLSNSTLRADYDETNDDDDGDDVPGESVNGFLDVGELLSEKYKRKINLWQEEFQQFIITDNFQEFFGELFFDVLKSEGNVVEFFECTICERKFVSSEEHYEMVLNPYFKRYDLDSGTAVSVTDTLRSEFSEEVYDWNPRNKSVQMGVWENEIWTCWEEVRKETADYIDATEKLKTEWSKQINIKFPLVSDLNVVNKGHLLYPVPGLRNSLKLMKCRNHCPEIHEGELIAVTSSLVKLDETHVPTYEVRDPAQFNNNNWCKFCETLVIFQRYHCRICGSTMCKICRRTCEMFVLGINDYRSICHSCRENVLANYSILWANEALELVMEEKFELARAYIQISISYGNLDEIPKCLSCVWVLIVDKSFSQKQFDIVFSLCCALNDDAYSLVIAKKLYAVEEFDWTVSLLGVVNSANWSAIANMFIELKPHPGVITFCLEKAAVTGIAWIDFAKRFNLARDPTLADLIAACINKGYKSSSKSEWKGVVTDLFKEKRQIQMALWALSKFSDAELLMFFPTLVKECSTEAIVSVLKYFEDVSFANLSKVRESYLLYYLQNTDKCFVIEEMFDHFRRSNVSNAIKYAAYLYETGKYDFKSAIFEKVTDGYANTAIFCAKIFTLANQADQSTIWFDLGKSLYSRSNELGRICFLMGHCDCNKLGDYFFERGDHKSAIQYYILTTDPLGKISAKAEELNQKGDHNFLLYYSVVTKEILNAKPENIELLTSVILKAFGNQDVLDKIFVAILGEDFQRPTLASSLKIHANFLRSKSEVQNVTPECIALCLAVAHILPENSKSRREFMSKTFINALKTNFVQAIYQADFALFEKCLRITTHRALGVINDLLQTYLGDRNVSSCPPAFKCLMLLLQATVAKLQNDIFGAIQKYHEALTDHPTFTKEVVICIVGQLKDCHIHESIYQNLIDEARSLRNILRSGREIDTNEFHMICTRITPSQVCKFAQFFGRMPVITAVRKSEIQIEKRLHNNSVDAAMCYVNLSIAAPDSSSTLGCFQMAISYLLKAMDETAEINLKYAYSKMITELSIMIYFLARKISQPYMQWYFTRFVISAALKSNQKLAVALRGYKFGRNGEIKSLVGSLQRNFLSEVLSRHLYLVKVTPIYSTQMYSALDAIYLNLSSSEFMQALYNAKLGYPYSTERFPIHTFSHEKFEGIWHGWIDNANFDEARIACMHDLLTTNGWTMEDVQHILEWPLVARTNEGWLSDKIESLDFKLSGGNSFKSFCGFKLNLETGEVSLLLDSGSAILTFLRIQSYSTDLFSLADIADIFENGVCSAHFSLEQPDRNMWSHPFQEAKYYPPSLSGTDYLSTLIHTDVLLKEFTTGIEACSKPPFPLRMTSEGLLKRLPKHLAEIVAPLQDSTDLTQGDSVHRFWIDVTDIVVDVDQTDNMITYKFGEVKATVEKKLQHRDESGNLIDDELDDGDSAEAKFAKEFSKHYDEFGKYFPEFLRLKQLAKISMACGLLKGMYKMVEQQKVDLDGDPFSFTDKVSTSLQSIRLQIKLPEVSQNTVDEIVGQVLSKNGVNRWQVSSSVLSDLNSEIWRQLREARQSCIDSIAKQLAELFAAKSGEICPLIEPWLNGEYRSINKLERITALAVRNRELTRIGKILDGIRNTGLKMDDRKVDDEISLSNKKGECAWIPATFCTSKSETRPIRVYGGVAIRPSAQIGSVRESGCLVSSQLQTAGRAGRQARLRELENDPKLSSAHRGWIRQEQIRIERGQTYNIRNPPGTHLAHRRGFEAAKGFGYEHSVLQNIGLHRTQHKHDNQGRANKTPSWYYKENKSN